MRFKIVVLVIVIAVGLAACGGQETTSSGTVFSIDLSGVIQGTLSSDSGRAALVNDDSMGANMIVYTLNFNDPTLGAAVNILFYGTDNKPAVGSYEIVNTQVVSQLNGLVSALVIVTINDDTGALFGQSGTITIDAAGRTYTGSFEFKATVMSDHPANTPTVTVKGTFSGVPAS